MILFYSPQFNALTNTQDPSLLIKASYSLFYTKCCVSHFFYAL